MSRLNSEQVERLLRPIKPERVMHANGQSHVPAYDTAAHLTRIFGFGGWNQELLSCTLLFEDHEVRVSTKDNVKKEYKIWTVGYSATVRLTIKDEFGAEVSFYENGATGDAVNQPSRGDAHHVAMTTAISTSLKRCAAFGLGDQFGLSLYNKGNTNALIIETLVMPEFVVSGSVIDLEDGIPKPLSLGNDEREIMADEDGVEIHRPSSDEQSETQSSTGLKGGDVTHTPVGDLTPLQAQIKAHPQYTPMDSSNKGAFLSDHAGYQVTSIRQLSDADCEQILAALKNREKETSR